VSFTDVEGEGCDNCEMAALSSNEFVINRDSSNAWANSSSWLTSAAERARAKAISLSSDGDRDIESQGNIAEGPGAILTGIDCGYKGFLCGEGVTKADGFGGMGGRGLARAGGLWGRGGGGRGGGGCEK